jgi:putative NADH-flavin reductase
MRLLIFGPTGGTGRELVVQALGRGHSVTAFARDPAALEERDGLRIVAGDVLDPAAVRAVVPGHDAVLCALGKPATSPGRLRSEGTANIIRAMASGGPDRLVCQSTIGVGDTREQLPPLYRYLLVPTLLRRTFAEHERQEAIVGSSDLEWTIVRAGALTDGARTGNYRHGFPPSDRALEFKIARGDVAEFTLETVEHGRHLREATSISY